MKKNKTKSKATVKEPAPSGARGQVVKLKPGKPRTPWTSKLPPVKQYWLSTKQFVVEAWQELKKVVWPSRKDTLGGTAMVLFLVVVISIFLGLVDFGLSRLVRTFIH
ncbi:MAG: preprotein translocase subunit SecE [Desulfobaccales bacterium]|nr:preprotein translocase subunit SecE [Desulfobaccales bacterium]